MRASIALLAIVAVASASTSLAAPVASPEITAVPENFERRAISTKVQQAYSLLKGQHDFCSAYLDGQTPPQSGSTTKTSTETVVKFVSQKGTTKKVTQTKTSTTTVATKTQTQFQTWVVQATSTAFVTGGEGNYLTTVTYTPTITKTQYEATTTVTVAGQGASRRSEPSVSARSNPFEGEFSANVLKTACFLVNFGRTSTPKTVKKTRTKTITSTKVGQSKTTTVVVEKIRSRTSVLVEVDVLGTATSFVATTTQTVGGQGTDVVLASPKTKTVQGGTVTVTATASGNGDGDGGQVTTSTVTVDTTVTQTTTQQKSSTQTSSGTNTKTSSTSQTQTNTATNNAGSGSGSSGSATGTNTDFPTATGTGSSSSTDTITKTGSTTTSSTSTSTSTATVSTYRHGLIQVVNATEESSYNGFYLQDAGSSSNPILVSSSSAATNWTLIPSNGTIFATSSSAVNDYISIYDEICAGCVDFLFTWSKASMDSQGFVPIACSTSTDASTKYQMLTCSSSLGYTDLVLYDGSLAMTEKAYNTGDGYGPVTLRFIEWSDSVAL